MEEDEEKFFLKKLGLFGDLRKWNYYLGTKIIVIYPCSKVDMKISILKFDTLVRYRMREFVIFGTKIGII